MGFKEWLSAFPLIKAWSTSSRTIGGHYSGLFGSYSSSGSVVTTSTALTVSAVSAAVKVLSEDIAKLPIQVERRREVKLGDYNTYYWERVDHPLEVVLARMPNDYMTPFEWLAYTVSQMALKGNALSVIVGAKGSRSQRLVPVDWNRVSMDLDQASNQIKYRISASDEEQAQIGRERYMELAPDEVLHFKWPLLNEEGFAGLSPIELAKETIGTAIATDTHQATSFKNSIDRSFMLTSDQRILPEDVQRMTKAFRENYRMGNADRGVPILHSGLKPVVFSQSNQEAQLAELKKMITVEIARCYRIPPHKLMDLDNAHFSNMEEMNKDYLDSTLQPLLTGIEQQLMRKLFTMQQITAGGLRINFDTRMFTRGRSTDRMERNTKGIQHGVFTSNEARLDEGYPPRADGDDTYVQVNMVPQSLMNDMIKANIKATKDKSKQMQQPAPSKQPDEPTTSPEPKDSEDGEHD
jgi:HK97 family phage portal protein